MATLNEYRAMIAAYNKAHPYLGDTSQYYDANAMMSGGVSEAEMAATNKPQDAWVEDNWQGWRGSMAPNELAEYDKLAHEKYISDRNKSRMAALAAFGGIAGAGMLGMGMLGSGAVGSGGIGTLGGLEALPAGLGTIAEGGFAAIPEIGGALGGLEGMAAAAAPGYASGLTAAEMAGIAEMMGGAGTLGGGAAGIAGNNFSAWLPAGTEALGAGTAAIPTWALPGGASAAELAGMGLGGAGSAGGSSWLSQLGSLLGGGGGTGGPGGLGSLLGGGSGGVNWLNLLGNLGGGYLQSQASGNATDAQLQASRESNALLEKMWQQGRADQSKYLEDGNSALAGIQALLKDPSSVSSMPDYQFGLDQGSKALQNSATARGMTYSGPQAKALKRYGNDYAGTKLGESFNRLASIAGIGQTATNQTGAMGQGYAGQMANNITGAGNSQAAGYIGQGNAWNNAIGGALNGLSEQDLINALMNRGN